MSLVRASAGIDCQLRDRAAPDNPLRHPGHRSRCRRCQRPGVVRAAARARPWRCAASAMLGPEVACSASRSAQMSPAFSTRGGLHLRHEIIVARDAGRRRQKRHELLRVVRLEEHVHELPQHVIQRFGDFLDDEWAGRRRSGSSISASAAPSDLLRPVIRTVSRPSARCGEHGGADRRRHRFTHMPEQDVGPARERPQRRGQGISSVSRATVNAPMSPVSASAGRARLPTITGWTNSTAACCASLACAPSTDHQERSRPGESIGHATTALGDAP